MVPMLIKRQLMHARGVVRSISSARSSTSSSIPLLDAAHTSIDLGSSGVYPAQHFGLVVGERVHSAQREVEPSVGVINGQDVDRVAVVGELPASTALFSCGWSASHLTSFH